MRVQSPAHVAPPHALYLPGPGTAQQRHALPHTAERHARAMELLRRQRAPRTAAARRSAARCTRGTRAGFARHSPVRTAGARQPLCVHAQVGTIAGAACRQGRTHRACANNASVTHWTPSARSAAQDVAIAPAVSGDAVSHPLENLLVPIIVECSVIDYHSLKSRPL